MIKGLLRKTLYTIENFYLSHLLVKNEELRNKHYGKKAFLFATGTSMLGLDLSKFNGEVTLGCNEIFRHPSFPSLDLKYYVAGVPFRQWRQIGPRFTHEDHHQYFLEIDKAFRNKNTTHLYHATVQNYLMKRGLLSGISRYYFLRKSALIDSDEQQLDLAKPVSFIDGGLTAMIVLAMFMGCKEIYLFGCGYTYSPVQSFHFYNCMRCSKDIEKEDMEVAIKSFQLAHPETDFIGTKISNVYLNDAEFLADFSSYVNTEEGSADDYYKVHRLALSLAEANGVRIMNVVPPGYESPVYQKVLIETILS